MAAAHLSRSSATYVGSAPSRVRWSPASVGSYGRLLAAALPAQVSHRLWTRGACAGCLISGVRLAGWQEDALALYAIHALEGQRHERELRRVAHLPLEPSLQQPIALEVGQTDRHHAALSPHCFGRRINARAVCSLPPMTP
jgi:hypothetical protein